MEVKILILAGLFSFIAALYHAADWRAAKTGEG
jgi:hypothetical protein